MLEQTHPLAPNHIPGFLPGADGSDPLFTVVVIIFLAAVLTIGISYLRLHSLPEHIDQIKNSGQMKLVPVLTILALFTHNTIFWVLALLLAVIRIPDFLTPINSIASSLKKLTDDEENIDTTHSSGAETITQVDDSPSEEK